MVKIIKQSVLVFICAFLLVGCDWLKNWVGYDDCYPLAWLPDATAGEPYHTEINTGTEDYSFIAFEVRDKNYKWQTTEDTGLQWQFTDLYNNPEVANSEINYKNIAIYGIPKNRYRSGNDYVKVWICSDVTKPSSDCQPKYCLKIDGNKENL